MGCIPWTYLKKKKNLRKEKGRKCLEKNQEITRNVSPREDKDLQTPRSTTDEDSITVGVMAEVPTVSEDQTTPVAKTVPPARKRSADKLVGAEAGAILANVKRLEARIKRKEEAKEAKRLRKLKAAKEQTDGATPDSAGSVLPDQDGNKANMKDLAKRCKVSRRIQRIAELLHLNDEMAEGLETALSPFFRF